MTNVTAVIVTYGDRRHLLEATLRCVHEQGVSMVIVVDNGASWGVSKHLSSERVDVVSLVKNTGSAGGFAAGISRAMYLGAGMIWLLDDDLCPEKDCLASLLYQYSLLLSYVPKDNLAVVAARQEYLKVLSTPYGNRLMNPSLSSFLEFSVKEIGHKIRKRMRWQHVSQSVDLPDVFQVQMAPYGGLLFHRSVVERIGTPATEFVLYMDDYEFTNRISRGGGIIMLVTIAKLTELEQSWHQKQKHYSSFHAWLSGPDYRVYYTARNLIYFELQCRTDNGVLYMFNKLSYLTLLLIVAVIHKRMTRFRLLLNAIRAGTTGQLGMDGRFPLS